MIHQKHAFIKEELVMNSFRRRILKDEFFNELSDLIIFTKLTSEGVALLFTNDV